MKAIELAVITELKAIHQLTTLCGIKLKEMGIHQWDGNYPSLSVLEKDIQKKELYLYKEHDVIVGIIVLNQDNDFSYTKIKWLTPPPFNSLIVHRLAVHPEHQGKGIAKQLMQFAEEKCQEQNCQSIRLDTFEGNPNNLAFYQKLNYQLVGKAKLTNYQNFPVICFEKIIVKNQ